MIVRLLRRALLVSAIALTPSPVLAANGEICTAFNSDPSEERVVLVLIDRTSPLRPNAQQAVRNAVTAAIEAGWNPASRGKPVNFDVDADGR